jgi:hypothetical protein
MGDPLCGYDANARFHCIEFPVPEDLASEPFQRVVGVDPDEVLPALRRHLDRHGFPMVKIAKGRDEIFRATRLDPEHPWVQWAAGSIAKTAGARPAILPNSGGSLPNDIFSDVLAMPTIWVPHSYLGCSQHAPNERHRTRRPAAHGRPVLGFGRARHALTMRRSSINGSAPRANSPSLARRRFRQNSRVCPSISSPDAGRQRRLSGACS